MTVFNKLPQDIQEQVKADLGMYDETHVTFENGSYIVSSNVVLRNHYPTDHTYIGTYKATDIFTREEHIKAQIMTFGYSPTYGINFYTNKQAWSDETLKYEDIRNAYIREEIKSYVDMFGHEPSQEWINRK
jgi:hypothetical protein